MRYPDREFVAALLSAATSSSSVIDTALCCNNKSNAAGWETIILPEPLIAVTIDAVESADSVAKSCAGNEIADTRNAIAIIGLIFMNIRKR